MARYENIHRKNNYSFAAWRTGRWPYDPHCCLGVPVLTSRDLPKQVSFERIRLNLISRWLQKPGEGCKVVAFASRSRGAGVSTVVAGLARSFGAADPGRVLVLDASGLNHGVAHYLGVRVAPAELPKETGDLRQRITRNGERGVDMLALAGAAPLRPDSATAVQALLASVRTGYQTILVDAGALDAGWATCWLASSDFRVLVVDGATATREVLLHQRRQLDQSGIRFDGFILNKRPYPIPRFLYWLTG